MKGAQCFTYPRNVGRVLGLTIEGDKSPQLPVTRYCSDTVLLCFVVFASLLHLVIVATAAIFVHALLFVLVRSYIRG